MAGFGFNIGLDGRNAEPLTERDAEEIAGALAEVYSQARETMLKSVSARLARGVMQYGWAERKASEVLDAHHQLEKIYDRASKQGESLLNNVIERAMLTGNQKFYQDMKDVLGNVAHISPNAAKAGYILADLNNALDAAHRRILRQFDDRYADVIATAAAKMATGVTNARQAVGEALTAFADNGVDCFIDRGGHRWTMENYSEMAVLTAIERSTVAGYVDTMQSYDYDLALIDGHAGSCPICAAWEGVIVSVSGDNPDYPSLGDAENDGCFHPRCLHGITTYYPGITHEPKGGFRSEPREVEDPGPSYTSRSKQRYMERQIRKYKDRAIVAQTPSQLMAARNKTREWEKALDQLIEDQPDDNYMYRQKGREKARTALLRSADKSGNIKLPNIRITKGVGPRGRNYWVLDFQTGNNYPLVPDTVIRNVEVFAGKGTKNVFRAAEKYAEKYGGKAEDWQHVKGYGELETDDGDRRAEIHWVQHEEIGRFEFFVKRWLDE